MTARGKRKRGWSRDRYETNIGKGKTMNKYCETNASLCERIIGKITRQ